jgi:hypothetical protein
MARVGIIGSSYTSQSVIADCQRTMNWYQENIESQMGASAAALYPTPGLSVFAAIAGPVRGLLEINGRLFAVGAGNFYEINSAGSPTSYGAVGNDLQPVTMATNGTLGNQIVICSAGALYFFNLTTNVLTPVGGLQGIPAMVVFCSSYFVALLAGTNKFQISNLLDGSTWNPLGVQQNEVFPENISSIVSAYGFLFVLGQAGHSQVYYNSGASQYTPFSPISGAYMEEGCGAPLSPVVMDNTVFWLGGLNGKGDIAWRANGYTPLRVSNFGFETAVASYPAKGSDAIGYTYRDQGHTFWVLRFPSANGGLGATWVYDAATQQWHERGYWSQQGPSGYSAHLSTCHAFAFGQHLVGDWNSGNIYAMAITTLQDNGNPIRRWRRSPHITAERERIFLERLQLDVEVGLGPQPPFAALQPPLNESGVSEVGKLVITGQSGDRFALSVNSVDRSLVTASLAPQAQNPPFYRGPQISVRISRDGSKTWGQEYLIDCGQAGDYKTRVLLRRLGQARDFVFDIVATDPAPWRIIEGYVEGTGFPQPTQRLQKQIAQVQ